MMDITQGINSSRKISEIIEAVKEAQKHITDLETTLADLRRNNINGKQSWQYDIHKDERTSVKVLYAEYYKRETDLDIFLNTKVVDIKSIAAPANRSEEILF